jgi:hypothetical protein
MRGIKKKTITNNILKKQHSRQVSANGASLKIVFLKKNVFTLATDANFWAGSDPASLPVSAGGVAPRPARKSALRDSTTLSRCGSGRYRSGSDSHVARPITTALNREPLHAGGGRVYINMKKKKHTVQYIVVSISKCAK